MEKFTWKIGRFGDGEGGHVYALVKVEGKRSQIVEHFAAKTVAEVVALVIEAQQDLNDLANQVYDFRTGEIIEGE